MLPVEASLAGQTGGPGNIALVGRGFSQLSNISAGSSRWYPPGNLVVGLGATPV